MVADWLLYWCNRINKVPYLLFESKGGVGGSNPTKDLQLTEFYSVLKRQFLMIYKLNKDNAYFLGSVCKFFIAEFQSPFTASGKDFVAR